MTEAWSNFKRSLIEGGAQPVSSEAETRIARFADLETEYHALARGPALFDRSHRRLLAATGADRATWLHNLTSNQVKPLAVGDGNYAFCLNVQGRILFDLNVLVGEESIDVDLDEVFLPVASAHFEKYTIIEDVTVVDRSDEFVRLGLSGEAAPDVLARLGATNAANMPLLGRLNMSWNNAAVRVVRSDYCGPFGLELFVPADRAVDVWRWLVEEAGAVPVGEDAMEIRRIEAGLPRPGRELTDAYLPAETGQAERAVSRNKGCYLGQEIVERMHARGVVARRLVGLVMTGDERPSAGAGLTDPSGTTVGTVTSVCRSLLRRGIIGLGYVRTEWSEPGRRLETMWRERSVGVTVAALPFTA